MPTPAGGSTSFPVTENEFYTAVETIARQEIRSVKAQADLTTRFFIMI